MHNLILNALLHLIHRSHQSEHYIMLRKAMIINSIRVHEKETMNNNFNNMKNNNNLNV